MLFTLLVFVIILGLLVLSHEFGHFVAARKSGMKVYEFGFGFPPRLFGLQMLRKSSHQKDANPKRKWRIIWGRKSYEELPSVAGYEAGTIYSFNFLPLGGFVRIKGEEGKEKGPDSFMAKSFGKKAVVLVAGVAMNIILAMVIFSIGFMNGLPQALTGEEKPELVSNKQLQIMQVLPDMPAGQAGLRSGDAIIMVGDLENPSLAQMQAYVDQHKDSSINFKLKRGEELLDKTIQPTVYGDTGKGGIGVALADVGIIKYPWYKALYQGCIITALYLKEIVLVFGLLIKSLFTDSSMASAVSGPVGIAVMTGQIAQLGLPYLLNFTAVLSLNLAILNILPIPALDGGRLLFLVLGKIFRRKLSMRFEQIAHTTGFLVLMLLVVVITVRDIGRFSSSFRSLAERLF